MKEIKLLHLFPDLLSLYGEYGNMAILKKTLENMGYTVSLNRWNGGELNLDEYDFLYMGSGTEQNLLEATLRFLPYRESVLKSIAQNRVWLVTGNAMTVFTQQIQYQGQTYPGLSLFPCDALISDRRYMGDVLTQEAFGMPLIGYVNTSCVYSNMPTFLLDFRLGSHLGNDKQSSQDGLHQNNFFATQLLGPILVKNPHFLAHLASLLTNETPEFASDSPIQIAYHNSLQELTKRL